MHSISFGVLDLEEEDLLESGIQWICMQYYSHVNTFATDMMNCSHSRNVAFTSTFNRFWCELRSTSRIKVVFERLTIIIIADRKMLAIKNFDCL